jgi:hypothetical protein
MATAAEHLRAPEVKPDRLQTSQTFFLEVGRGPSIFPKDRAYLSQ